MNNSVKHQIILGKALFQTIKHLYKNSINTASKPPEARIAFSLYLYIQKFAYICKTLIRKARCSD